MATPIIYPIPRDRETGGHAARKPLTGAGPGDRLTGIVKQKPGLDAPPAPRP